MTDSQALRGLQTSACATLILLKSVIKGGETYHLATGVLGTVLGFLFVCLSHIACFFSLMPEGQIMMTFPFTKTGTRGVFVRLVNTAFDSSPHFNTVGN